MLSHVGDTAALERLYRAGARRQYEAIFASARRYWRTYDSEGVERRMRVLNKLVAVGYNAFGSLDRLEQHLKERLFEMQHNYSPTENGARLLTVAMLRIIDARRRAAEKKGGRDDV